MRGQGSCNLWFVPHFRDRNAEARKEFSYTPPEWRENGTTEVYLDSLGFARPWLVACDLSIIL